MTQSAGRSGRVTLEDVARRAEVSRALVSIVMRDAPGAAAATRERVLAAAAELGYRPDARARALAGQSSGLLGVMFGVGLGSFHYALLEGVYEAAESHGLNVIVSPLTPSRDEHKAAESLQDFSFDGLIMLGPPTARPLLAGRVPLVTVGWPVDDPSVDVVRTSDTQGMSAALDHLIELGHRRIAHLDGGLGLIADARRAAYLQGMRAAALAEHAQVCRGGQSQLDGQRAAQDVLAGSALPTAVIGYNDDVAAAAAGVFAQHGLRIPNDISVIGWDDNEAGALAPVALTSVAQRPRELAALAVARVSDRLQHQSIDDREVVLTPELKIRESTGPAPRD